MRTMLELRGQAKQRIVGKQEATIATLEDLAVRSSQAMGKKRRTQLPIKLLQVGAEWTEEEASMIEKAVPLAKTQVKTLIPHNRTATRALHLFTDMHTYRRNAR